MIHLYGPHRLFAKSVVAAEAEALENSDIIDANRAAYLGLDRGTLIGPRGHYARWRATATVEPGVPCLSPGIQRQARYDLRTRPETGDDTRDVRL